MLVNKRTRLRQQRLILELYNYQNCGAEERQKLETKAQQAAMVCGKPIYIFREILNYLREQRIVVPGYSFLQDTVGKAITGEQNRLIAIAHSHLKPSDIESLKLLLSDSQGLYEITLQIHDNLINCLIHDVRRYIDEAKSAAKERVYEYRIEQNQDLQKAGQVLKLFTDDSIEAATPFHQVQIWI